MTISEVLTQLIQAVVVAAIPSLVIIVKLALDELVKYFQSKTSVNNFELAKRLAGAAVMAAEQAGLVADAKNEVVNKKQMAFEFLDAALNKNGIDLDFDAINALIEAEVLNQFNYGKTQPQLQFKDVSPLVTEE